MCGILGVIDLSGQSRPVRREQFMSALASLAHRGPDDESCHFAPGVTLGFRRLSIVDLTQGRQPMANEDDTVWIIQNGEIYNHAELRIELTQGGHSFKSHSDAEVLIHGYEAWGIEGLLGRLRGMFAFVLWDARTHQLFAARDRMGIKPLYYAQEDGQLYLASEIRPILLASGMDRRVQLEGLALFMRTGFTPGPRTLFAGIMKLPAAHYLAIRNGRCTSHCYWRLSYASRQLPADEVIEEEFQERLHSSVAHHLMSDVPVGALLSGGIDSATILAHMTQLSPGPVTAITIGFQREGYDEKARASACAKELGLDHVLLDFVNDAMGDYPRMLAAMEEPVTGSIFAAFYHLFGACRERGIKVVLTGEGADELLGGYQWNWQHKTSNRLWSQSSTLLRAASSAQHPRIHRGLEWVRQTEEAWHRDSARLVNRYVSRLSIGAPELASQLLQEDLRVKVAEYSMEEMLEPWRRWVEEAGHRDPFQQLLWLQSRTRLPDFINIMVDRMSMAHSVEARPPFLDHLLWEYCAPLPRRLKVRGYYPNQIEKYLLRQAGRGLVPEIVRTAPKRGLRVPYGDWLLQPRLPDWAEEALSEGALRATGLFDPAQVFTLRRDTLRGHESRRGLLMAVITLQVWMQIFRCHL